jgi:hypothetical protein
MEVLILETVGSATCASIRALVHRYIHVYAYGSMRVRRCSAQLTKRDSLQVLDDMARRYEEQGLLVVFRGWQASKAIMVNTASAIPTVSGIVFSPVTAANSPLYGRSTSLPRRSATASLEIRAQIVIDGTELGDLLPLVGAAYRFGAESKNETNEPGRWVGSGAGSASES